MTPFQISRNKLQHSSWQFDAIGTRWTIETADPLDRQIELAITHHIVDFDHAFSRFRNDSIVTQMTKTAGRFELPDDGNGLALLYQKLYVATDGAMTPLVGDSMNAAGYDKTYSFIPTDPLPAPVWNQEFEWSDAAVVTKRPVTLDVGAAGKGKLVDIIANELIASHVSNYVIDASGDICHRGSDFQTIGLEDPNDTSRVIGTMPLANASLCASAVNRRRWGNGWHHVIDGRTGLPVKEVVATWVIADTTIEADGLATALFFVGADKLRHIAKFQFVKLFANGRIEHSHDFVGQLYI